LEWASFGLHTIFAQRRNLLRPSFYLMIADVLRFNRKAPEVRLDAITACTKL
jgi:predicted NAD/FAD-binding protein